MSGCVLDRSQIQTQAHSQLDDLMQSACDRISKIIPNAFAVVRDIIHHRALTLLCLICSCLFVMQCGARSVSLPLMITVSLFLCPCS